MPLQLSTSTYAILCNNTAYTIVIHAIHTIIQTPLHSHTHVSVNWLGLPTRPAEPLGWTNSSHPRAWVARTLGVAAEAARGRGAMAGWR
jgi:hypothetical protein